IIEDGKTGYIVESIDEAVKVLQGIDRISRDDCRRNFENRFSASIMANKYVQLYERILRSQRKQLSYSINDEI
ncbi:MAG TPA: hypothetical protein VKH37_10585, partial [Ferruginibacter sp.]|nr:hypothetical protein [Ferruginibacter sp.]